MTAFYQIFQILDQPMTLVRVSKAETTIHETNEAFCRLSGYTQEQLKGMSLELLIANYLPCDISLHFTQETVLTSAKQEEIAVHLEFRALTVSDQDDARYALIIYEDKSGYAHEEPLTAIKQVYDSSKRLKMWMAKRDISANQMAAATNISLQTISKLRNGHIQKPNRLTAELIAGELQVAVSDIWPEVRNGR
ncbi:MULTISPECIES: helix-turn-helix domain-containing protein [unclassified Paenibacillus]|uniref:helix-turn-helix domain-containing protein n=1 Tax=unclassified Paenibacillus TaxID=185978 RepID=UPI001043897D|nr:MULTISPECIES: helix-turn-helix domain-containing protein [unclassified Paenibacillus]NIK67559.1 PAS domain S-box-containing protein [Paenibacillus sp. BK720]TCN01600.1 PAS domain S-box-containing protein [Paenibacillus sp. BK033]